MHERHIWKAYRSDTRDLVSYPYYSAAACYKVAKREAAKLGVDVHVFRDDRYHKTYTPEGNEKTEVVVHESRPPTH